MGKTLKYGSHDFPAGKGFSGSAGKGFVRPHYNKGIAVPGHNRRPRQPPIPKMVEAGVTGDPTVMIPERMASGGTPSAVPTLRPLGGDNDPGGAVYGGGAGVGSGSASETERLSDAMDQGHAPFTAGGIAAALRNASGLIQGPIQAALATGLENAGIPGVGPGDLGGIQNIPGWKGFNPATQALVKSGVIKTMDEAIAHSEQADVNDVIGGHNNPGSGSFAGSSHADPYGTAGDRSSPDQAGRAGFKKGGKVLTAAKRHKMPSKEFALSGERFPVNDTVHQELAIPGATRSERAGNITHEQAEHVKDVARSKLGMAQGGKVRGRGVPAFCGKPVIGD